MQWRLGVPNLSKWVVARRLSCSGGGSSLGASPRRVAPPPRHLRCSCRGSFALRPCGFASGRQVGGCESSQRRPHHVLVGQHGDTATCVGVDNSCTGRLMTVFFLCVPRDVVIVKRVRADEAAVRLWLRPHRP